jgi:hypothetical protein
MMARRALALAVLVLALAPGAAAAAVSGAQATAVASRQPLVRRLERTHPGAFSQVSSPALGEWQVAFYSRDQEFVQVIVSRHDGRVLHVFTGIQIAWVMARGVPGAFGGHVTALYVWIPLTLLFLAPFADWRRPASMRNLDLAALSFFSLSLAFFDHGEISASVPLTYPPLVYLLARMLWLVRESPDALARAGRRRADRLPRRAERRGLERDRRRLRQRGRRAEDHRRRAAVRAVPRPDRPRRHLRPGVL